MTASRSPESDAVGADPVDDEPAREPPALNCYETQPGRTVLTEPGNTDGWIATDTTVVPWE